MSTVTKELADLIIAGDGWYEDDARVARVLQYTDIRGNPAYAVEYSWERGRYDRSGYVRNPVVIWEAKGAHT